MGGDAEAATSGTSAGTTDGMAAGLTLMRLVALGLAASSADAGAADPAAPRPFPTPDADGWRRIHALASRHAVEAVAWAGVTALPEHSAARLPDELRDRWEREARATLVRQLTYEAERETIADGLAAHGISVAPLKGAVLAERYPAPGLRSMGDNDVLFAVLDRGPDGLWHPRGDGRAARDRVYAGIEPQVDAVMASLGYERRPTSPMETDLQYLRPPFHFELHRDLLSPRSPLFEPLGDPWPAMAPDGPVPGPFHMTLADEYVFHIVHLHKHFTSAGCGVRFLVDEAVYLSLPGLAEEGTARRIRERLDLLGLAGFEREIRDLAAALLPRGRADGPAPDGPAPLTARQRDLFRIMLASGTFGTLDRQVANARRETGGEGLGGRLRYVARRLYPGSAQIRAVRPVYDRHPWLLPLFPLARLGSVLRHHPRKLLAELRLTFRRGGDRDGTAADGTTAGTTPTTRRTARRR